MNKIKIGIVGSILTRSCFEFGNKNYDVALSYYLNSIRSIVAPKLNIDVQIDKNTKKFDKDIIEKEINKDFFNDIKNSNIKYIVLDFIPDVMYGVSKINDSYVTNLRGKYRGSNIECKEIEAILSISSKNLDIWKKDFDKFIEEISIDIPKRNIIIHRVRFLPYYKDKNDNIKTFKSNNIMEKNEILKEMENYAIKKGCRVINLHNKLYFATEKHPWGLTQFSAEFNYNKDFLNKFNEYVINDIAKENLS